jgi:hypothetical protein
MFERIRSHPRWAEFARTLEREYFSGRPKTPLRRTRFSTAIFGDPRRARPDPPAAR